MSDVNILKSVPSHSVVSAKISTLTGDVILWTDDTYRSLADIRRIAELEKEREQLKLVLVGFTNGDQIESAKEESGSFYPTNEMQCYIPLYMLKSHTHRIETTKLKAGLVLDTKEQGE